MTLREMLEQGIKIQGRVHLKIFDELGDQSVDWFVNDYEYDYTHIPHTLFEECEVDYMYYAGDALQIELKERDD